MAIDTATSVRADFDAYLTELLRRCREHRDIIGLVLMGSTAERTRVDEWSDHDFAVVCRPGAEDRLREDLSWLPRSEGLVAAQEHHDGFKAFTRAAAVIEFAVVDLTGLTTFLANSYEVAYDMGGVAEVMQEVAENTTSRKRLSPESDMTVFLAALLIGVGRARRGEVLSASASVRGLCLDHLLATMSATLPGVDPDRLDTLDSRRRFELVYPTLGLQLAEALSRSVEDCARSLLDIAHEQLAERWTDYPLNAELTVRRRLGWLD